MFNFKDYRFLVIDDQPLVRQSLRACVQSMGGFAVDVAVGYQDAIHRIRTMPPDIVLCDYILGDGRSGQQLLEEVRRQGLLLDEVIFIMVTAEQAYEKVVACVELVPDDYILKPFSPELLNVRLNRLMVKKVLLKPFYVARREGRYDDAQRFLDEHNAKPEYAQYRVDFMRCEAELMLSRGRPDAAETIFRLILEIYAFPWANAGMARSMTRLGRHEEARTVLDRVIEDSPNFFEAYDLKAEACAEMGDYQAAQEALAGLVARSPKNYKRKRMLAKVSLAKGDFATATMMMNDVIANDTMPGAVTITDLLMLARTSLDAGDLLEAEKAILRAESIEMMELDDRLALTALRAVILPKQGSETFLVMRDAWLSSPMLPERLVDALHAALELGDSPLADQIATRLMNEDGVRRVFQRALTIYDHYGRQQDFRNIQKQAALARIRQS